MKSLFDSQNLRLLIFGLVALLITAGSLLYSNHLARKLLKEEEKRMELFALSQEFVGDLNEKDEDAGLTFVYQNITKTNELIPTIMADSSGNITAAMNLGLPTGISAKDSIATLQQIYQKMSSGGNAKKIEIEFFGSKNYIYYDESPLLKQLRWFPYLQLLVIVIFISVIFGSFYIAKKNEQNKVWVGLAKETAHQLGTPVSSLMAWVELLEMQAQTEQDTEVIQELQKDVDRLRIIAERFSKIGSKPELLEVPFREVIESAAEYIRKRMSKKVSLHIQNEITDTSRIAINRALFDWVIENLLKNALDAIPDVGKITISGKESANEYMLDITDTGKGIPRSQFKQVFKAGFTTKKRGWGLGLSLTKRIVEEYHQGKIFVKQSELGKGTTFRIILPKPKAKAR